VARWKAETLACEVSALRDVPINNQTRVEPPVYVPGRKVCDGDGTCTTKPGYWLPGQTYTVDTNKELRGRVEVQCMANKGYNRAEIPACPPSIKADGVTKVLPTLTPASCAIRNDDGSFLIVNRG